jgi:UDP-glucose 4-epimerase
MDQKRVVVTGGAGFLGSHVIRLLLQENYFVNILDDFSNGKIEHLEAVRNHANLNIIRGDIKNAKDVKHAFKDCQIVIHLAVLCLRQSIKNPQVINDVIVRGTMNCLDTAISNKVDLFINCSSSEAYGTAVYTPMDENHPLNPETPYAAAKVAQDMYVYSYGRTYGLPWTTIRPFNMYGPNSHWQGFRGELIPKMIVRAMNRKPLVVFGDGQQTRDFIYVEEAARAVLAVANNPKCYGQMINFCTGIETSILNIGKIICESFSLDQEKFIIFQPARPGDVQRHIGDNSKFKSLLGFTPVINIQEGISRTIDWFASLPYKPEEMLSQEVLKAWE